MGFCIGSLVAGVRDRRSLVSLNPALEGHDHARLHRLWGGAGGFRLSRTPREDMTEHPERISALREEAVGRLRRLTAEVEASDNDIVPDEVML